MPHRSASPATTIRPRPDSPQPDPCAGITGQPSEPPSSWISTRTRAAATSTSSDDELELATLDGLYTRTSSGRHITRYARTGHYFYVLADGNAVNFLHGASVGAFIFLVQAEILAALGTLAAGDHEPGMHELDAAERSQIAATWLHYFDGTS